MSKKTLGQFYTTKSDYILQGFVIPPTVISVIEPFVGNGDLLPWIGSIPCMELYDIDPKIPEASKRDTLKNPPDYTGKFVITNPPYLARNKSKDKTLFDKYEVNDLYKCFLKTLISGPPTGGIIIIPLNFFSSIRKTDIELRRDFLNVFNIHRINVFEEQVFDDTSYTVCSFDFHLETKKDIDVYFFPSKNSINTVLSKTNNYSVGGEIYLLPNSGKYAITRLTSQNNKNTNILVKCIDDKEKIGLKIVDDDKVYIDTTPNLSARTYATLVITPKLKNEEQEKLVFRFNNYLKIQRDKYNSLFLTNYREGTRKRISFDLVYLIVGYLLDNPEL
jgi:hypothetical protein